MKNNIFINMMIIVSFYNISFAQSLDQQLREAVSVGVLPTNMQLTLSNAQPNLATLNKNNRFFDQAPNGISSLIAVPNLVEEVQMGYLTTYFPKGYGQNQLHYGIWNAIPFVVFNNSTLELRFGLIFEHRQIGFVPDDWIETTLSATGLPQINFLIPPTKTFLNYANGTSQWRSTVLLTEEQITNLKLYAKTAVTPNPSNPYQDTFTVTHRFIDSSTRLYLLGVRNKDYLKILLELYGYIQQNPLVKTYQDQNTFPKGGFFDEILVNTNTKPVPLPLSSNNSEVLSSEEVSEEEILESPVTDEITESVITEEVLTAEDEYPDEVNELDEYYVE